MKKNGIDLGLREAFDDLFSTQEDRDNQKRTFLRDIPVVEISDFPDHPFKVRMDEDMENLVESVKERGVLSPVLVRPLADGSYQMVSGHRRKRASELAGIETVPCIVRELTDDEATITALSVLPLARPSVAGLPLTPLGSWRREAQTRSMWTGTRLSFRLTPSTAITTSSSGM